MSSDQAMEQHKNSYKSIRSATCINCHRNPIGDLPINMPKKRQRIELKWLHKSGCKSLQRTKKGGGTRDLLDIGEMLLRTLRKDVEICQLLGKCFYFPNGQSSKGNQSDFQCFYHGLPHSENNYSIQMILVALQVS